MSTSESEDFRRENCIIADIIVSLENLSFRHFQDEDLPSAVLHAIGTRLTLDAKTIKSQKLHFGNKSSQPVAVVLEE